LQVYQEDGSLHLSGRPAGSAYHTHSVTSAGDVLRLSEPVLATIDPAELLPPV
jgi:hypothetical protein